jgi:selenocysteine-specific elongation factor
VTIVVGTAGHIDHGKTTLLRALTGIDADRLPEEQRRGMTIDVGYAHLALDDGSEIDFVDVPGHDRLVGNMLVGAGEIDAALLVVAADDGPRAQTLEHLELLDALAIADGIAVVTKADAVDGERTDEVVAAVRRLLEPTSLAAAPVLVVSASSGHGLGELRAALVVLRDRVAARAARTAAALAPTATDGEARLAIDRTFIVKGRGTVVTGTLRGGPIRAGMALRLLPDGREVRIREVQVHGRRVESATSGRTALNLTGIAATDLHRGQILTNLPEVVSGDRLLVALRPAAGLSREPSVPADRTLVRLHLGTEQVGAVVSRSGRDAAELPTGELAAILRLERPVAIAPGDRFVLRLPSPGTTLAGGRVLDPDPPRGVSRRRTTAVRLGALALAATPDERAAARLELHGAIAGRPDRLAADVATAVRSVAFATARDAPAWLPIVELRAAAVTALRRLVTLSPLDAQRAASVVVVDGLVADGLLGREEERIGDPARPPSSGPGPGIAEAMTRLEAGLDAVAPPGLAEAARVAGCPPAGIRELEQSGRIVRLDSDLAYAAAALRRLEAMALELTARGPLTPAAFRDATGTSRKYVMAILEDLDRRGVLRRTAAGHVPGPRAAAASRR